MSHMSLSADTVLCQERVLISPHPCCYKLHELDFCLVLKSIDSCFLCCLYSILSSNEDPAFNGIITLHNNITVLAILAEAEGTGILYL